MFTIFSLVLHHHGDSADINCTSRTQSIRSAPQHGTPVKVTTVMSIGLVLRHQHHRRSKRLPLRPLAYGRMTKARTSALLVRSRLFFSSAKEVDGNASLRELDIASTGEQVSVPVCS